MYEFRHPLKVVLLLKLAKHGILWTIKHCEESRILQTTDTDNPLVTVNPEIPS